MLDKNDFSQIGKIIDDKLDKKLKPIKRDITHIKSGQKTLIGFFDKEYLDLRKQVKRIKEHLNLPSLS